MCEHEQCMTHMVRLMAIVQLLPYAWYLICTRSTRTRARASIAALLMY